MRAAAWALMLTVFATPAAAQDEAASLTAKANQGDADAQFQLAEAYLLGDKGLKQSDQEAAGWAQKAANQGNIDAEAMMAGFYLDGVGVAKDEAKAFDLADDAMGKKSAVAFFLASRMARAKSDADHDARANVLLRVGAYLGNRSSALGMGDVYALGLGVSADPLRSFAWYSVAAVLFGKDNAPAELLVKYRAAAAKLSPEQQKAGEELAERCLDTELLDCGLPDVPLNMAR
jgi:TPR repeat protein